MVVYFDDLLISGADRAEHDERMGEVLSRFRKYGVRVGREKCVFLQDQVQYLGYVVSRDGIQPEESKVRAIVAAPAPHDVQSLQSFLGMVNFYCRFGTYLRCSLPSTIFLKSTLPGNGRTTTNMRSSQSRNFSQRLRCLRIIAMTSL